MEERKGINAVELHVNKKLLTIKQDVPTKTCSSVVCIAMVAFDDADTIRPPIELWTFKMCINIPCHPLRGKNKKDAHELTDYPELGYQ
jgi:hypothetical protein